MEPTRRSLEYLVTCSDAGLESFELSRLNRASMLRKEARQLFERLIEMEVDARLARCLLECKRGQISLGDPGQQQLNSVGPQPWLAPSDAAQTEPPALSGAPKCGSPTGTTQVPSTETPAKRAGRRGRKSLAANNHALSRSENSVSSPSPVESSRQPLSLGQEEESALEDLEAFVRRRSPKATPDVEPQPVDSQHSKPESGTGAPSGRRIALLPAREPAGLGKRCYHPLTRLHRAS